MRLYTRTYHITMTATDLALVGHGITAGDWRRHVLFSTNQVVYEALGDGEIPLVFMEDHALGWLDAADEIAYNALRSR